MIAKKIESVIRRFDKLEYMVSPEAWAVIRLGMNELQDAAASADALERSHSLKPAGLTVIDLFTEADTSGTAQVSPEKLGDILGDLAEALRDMAAAPQTRGLKFSIIRPSEGF